MATYTTPWGDQMPLVGSDTTTGSPMMSNTPPMTSTGAPLTSSGAPLTSGSPLTSGGPPTAGAPATAGAGGGSSLASLLGGVGGLGGGTAQLLQYFFGKNPSSGANKYLSQIPDILKQYMSPYADMGTRAMGVLEPTYQQLLSDPGGVMSKIGGGFQESPGYEFSRGQAEGAAGRAAAAGGMAGSPMQQQETAKAVTGLANQDYYNYLDRAMNMYGKGLQGEQGMLGMGQQAASGLSEDLVRSLMGQANLKYSGDQQRQNQLWGGIGSLIGGGAGLAALLAGM